MYNLCKKSNGYKIFARTKNLSHFMFTHAAGKNKNATLSNIRYVYYYSLSHIMLLSLAVAKTHIIMLLAKSNGSKENRLINLLSSGYLGKEKSKSGILSSPAIVVNMRKESSQDSGTPR